MNRQIIITSNAIVGIAFGIAFTVYGPIMIAFFNLPAFPGENVLLYWFAVSFARLFGAALFTLGMLLWSLRSVFRLDTEDNRIARGVLFALLLGNLVGFVVALTQQFAFWSSAAGWVTVALFGLYTLGYGWLLFFHPNSTAVGE